jgi:hypothetical protein
MPTSRADYCQAMLEAMSFWRFIAYAIKKQQ